MKKVAILMLVFSLLILVPSVVRAQVPTVDWTSILKIMFGPNIPSQWQGDTYLFFQFLIAPFLLITLVLFGILTEIRIFKRFYINGVIAILIAFMASYSGALVILVQWTSALVGGLGYFAFLGLLIFGIICWVIWRGKDLWGRTGIKWSLVNDETKWDKKLAAAQHNLTEATKAQDQDKINQYTNEVKEAEAALKNIQSQKGKPRYW